MPSSAYVKINFRVLVSIVDAFHFEVTEPAADLLKIKSAKLGEEPMDEKEGEEDADEVEDEMPIEQKIYVVVVNHLLPRLIKCVRPNVSIWIASIRAKAYPLISAAANTQEGTAERLCGG